MCRLSAPRPYPKAGARGFTLIEAMVTMLILATLLGVGYPAMSRMIHSSRAQNVVEFYYAGMELARRSALGNISQSRMLLKPNTISGQYDWQVDICFIASGDCGQSSSNWSTDTASAKDDPQGKNGYKSVVQLADKLPKADQLEIKLFPPGNDKIYLSPNGWVNNAVPNLMTQMRFTLKKESNNNRKDALSMSLAGITSRCDYEVPNTDARACP